MTEIKIVKKYESGLRVEGLYSHKGKTGTVVDSTEAFTTLKWDGAKKASTVQSHKIRPLETKIELDAPKPASAYVDNIPDWFESEIIKLSSQERLFLVNDLTWAIIHSKWNLVNDVSPVKPIVYNWLDSQDRDTFKALLQWVVMELI